MSRSKNSFQTLLNLKNRPLGPQTDKKDPKIKSKSNVRIERNKENEICLTTWVDPKTVFEPFPEPKNSPPGPQKSKMTPKLSGNQISEFKKTYRMKVVQLHE